MLVDWCTYHARYHGGDDFGALCRAWEQATQMHRGRLSRLLKRLTVCWWKHRTRAVGPGTYVTAGCRACTKR